MRCSPRDSLQVAGHGLGDGAQERLALVGRLQGRTKHTSRVTHELCDTRPWSRQEMQGTHKSVAGVSSVGVMSYKRVA